MMKKTFQSFRNEFWSTLPKKAFRVPEICFVSYIQFKYTLRGSITAVKLDCSQHVSAEFIIGEKSFGQMKACGLSYCKNFAEVNQFTTVCFTCVLP